MQKDQNGFAIGNSRPENVLRNAIAAFLFTFSSRCVVCNKETVRGLSDTAHNAFQVGHIVPGGTKRNGWIAGNLATMCRSCNSFIGDTDCTSFLPRFKNVAGIAMVWPTNNELKAMFPMIANNDSAESISICEEIFA